MLDQEEYPRHKHTVNKGRGTGGERERERGVNCE